MLFYEYDKDQYYSSPSNKYLIITLKPENTSFLKNDENIIKLGFYLSILSNRKYILPKIYCSKCKKKNISAIYCNYLTFFSIIKLETYLGGLYRENVLIIKSILVFF